MSDTINNTKQFLDKDGLSALWDKICRTIGTVVNGYIPETVNITYAELVELRNNCMLKPGEKYRITDYVTTVKSNQMDVISGNHRFDIIVEALDNRTLSEQAKAVRHEDDWYFESENLEAWQLWYCLDNDKNRFEWADNVVMDYKAEFIGAYTIDLEGNKGEYHIDKDYAIYEWDVLSHPDTGDDCIVLYTQDPIYYSERGVDYADVYFYDGIVTADAQEYDSWKKYDVRTNEWVTPDTDRNYYLLTERIVFGNEVIWPDVQNTSNGKGVIYRMIDEYGNDCPYDFKNIKYYCEGMGTYVYTFTWIDEGYNVMDTSVFGNNGVLTYYGEIYGVHNNVIKPYYETGYDNPDEYTGIYLCKQILNNITFISEYLYESIGNDGFYGCDSNSFGNDCRSNMFGNKCCYNIFGDGCYNNIFGTSCYSNIIGDGFYSNIIGDGFYYNNIGNSCYSNTFNGDCYYNSFGNYCYNNTFGTGCYANIIGNTFRNNTFGIFCHHNRFGNDFHSNGFVTYCEHNNFGNNFHNNHVGSNFRSNIFGNDCRYNRFGSICYQNDFGNNCCYNMFGSNFRYNSLGNSCRYNTLMNNIDGQTADSCEYNRFDDGCSHNTLHGEDGSQTGCFCNLHIVRGVCGSDDEPNYINIAVSENATYEIKVAKNSNGEIKVYCEADLIA
jgi:hypothetical protein